MKKKIFPLILTISLLSSCSPFDQNLPSSISSTPSSSVIPSIPKETPLFSYINLNDGTEVKITSYNPKSFLDITNVEIPETIDGKKVTIIGKEAFKDQSSIISLTFSSSVTEIEEGAFYGCSSLKELTIPNNIKKINNRAFMGCSSLKKVSIPDDIKYIGNYAFTNCSSLKDINIPENDNITSISNYFLSGCTSLESVLIPSNIKTIGNYAFYGCSSLTTINIPNSILTIGSSAFSNCVSLQHIDLKETIQTIDKSAFSNCTSLKNITLPKDTTIASDAFSGCEISKINFSNLITKLDSETLNKYLSRISSSSYTLTIPSSVTEIDLQALNDYPEITEINVNKNNINYSSVDGILYDFDQTTLLKCPIGKRSIYEIPSTVKTISKNSFYNCSNLDVISLPKSVTKVENNAFTNCSNLKSITIPLSVLEMGKSFEGCKSIIMINCEAPTKPFDWNDEWNYLDNNNSLTVNWNSEQNSILDDGIYYTLEDENSTFAIVSSFKDDDIEQKVELKNEVSIYGKTYPVKEIKKGAFYNCDALKTISLADSIETINEKVFEECTNLEVIIFPKTIKTMNSMFTNCISLKVIYLEASSTAGFIHNFNVISSNKKVDVKTNFEPIVNTKNNIEYTLNNNYEIAVNVSAANKSNIVSNITLLDQYEIDGVTYPVTSIEDDAFSSCTRLTSIVLPTYLTSIGDNAFYRTNLSNVSLGEYVSTIGDHVFENCPNLSSISVSLNNDYFVSEQDALYEKNEDNSEYRLIKVPEGKIGSFSASNKCNQIDSYAFYNCVSLTNIDISRTTITDLNESTFENCIGLLNPINLPNTLINIKAKAFKNCSSEKFTTLDIPATIETIDLTAFDSMDSLVSINIDTENTIFSTIDGVLYNHDASELLKVPQSYQGKLTLPSTLEKINENALDKCTKVNAFEINDNENFYTSNLGLLYNSSKTTLLYFPKALDTEFEFETTTTKINEKAFDDCINVSTIKLIPSITIIPNNAFKTCSNLENIYVNDTAFKNLNNYFNLNNIKTLTINSDVKSDISTSTKSTNSIDMIPKENNLTIIVANGNTSYSLDDGALIYKKSSSERILIKLLKSKEGSYIIPSNITSISSDAFSDTSISRIYIPNNVVTISSQIFKGLTDLDIYAYRTSKPNTWSSTWLINGPSESNIHWGVSQSDFPV